jgi:phosphatidylserine/phosphatidylglycerophosphate/cardiolipin synthase-like enzyme
LIQQGIPVKVLGGKEKGVIHHRFAILDEKRVLKRSFDRSEASLKWNDENILILHESEAVATFQKEFDRLW